MRPVWVIDVARAVGGGGRRMAEGELTGRGALAGAVVWGPTSWLCGGVSCRAAEKEKWSQQPLRSPRP